MADVFSKAKRSDVMSRIRSHKNKDTELRLISIFQEFRVTGWRRRQKLIGNPDFVFRSERVAVFVDGCFWHACPRCYRAPTSNKQYWIEKRDRNARRDKLVGKLLRQSGWAVLRIWEHELRNSKRVLKRIQLARQKQ
jgi:DNA mismatch endonuclease (patch repair protein)